MQSNWTLLILLVVLVCQVLASGVAFSVQYPSGDHPMGIAVSHHHQHSFDLKAGHNHGTAAFNATESVERLADSEASAMTGEHEHSNHSHTPSHPPVDPSFLSCFLQSETLTSDDVFYLTTDDAPPIPPPHT
ncbi:hypothetical protein HWQ46_07315 [Shewanella sp. D64]|uniref:hypothetical protein n=1 Tax=unclassified Shewanella TaxID=196818 RepID=UPI0022BA6FAD|nr:MULTISPECIES: hypothetical protein [unclassified Shewanella]MEC4725353.1 hypothetical protein [Shewanella sp. D64]MEC4735801.1 hypothetical protein [Shewanella sp. E94]WBJ93228.1 hypothetical protein HWQ47_14815 [Shewanella sp. MTB7]